MNLFYPNLSLLRLVKISSKCCNSVISLHFDIQSHIYPSSKPHFCFAFSKNGPHGLIWSLSCWLKCFSFSLWALSLKAVSIAVILILVCVYVCGSGQFLKNLFLTTTARTFNFRTETDRHSVEALLQGTSRRYSRA